MAGYTRQETYTTGDTIEADDTNNEFDVLVTAFHSTSGHKHDGTAAEGGRVPSLIDADGDTKIMVEESSDDDTIRVDASTTAQDVLTVSPTSVVWNDAGSSTFGWRLESDTDDYLIHVKPGVDVLAIGSSAGSTLMKLDVGGRANATSFSLNAGAVVVSTILDEDAMTSNSSVALVTQQSIVSYVATQMSSADTYAELGDVTVSTLANNDLTKYVSASTEWQNLTTGSTTQVLRGGTIWGSVEIHDIASGTDGELVTWSSAGTATTVAVGTSGHVLTSGGAGEQPDFTTVGLDSMATGTDGELFTWSTTGTATTVAVGSSSHVLVSAGAGEKPSFAALGVGSLADGTDGELVTWSTTGTATTVAVGTSGYVLTSNGAGEKPSFQAVPSSTSIALANLADGTDGELVTWSTTGTATTVAVGTAGHVLTSAGAGEKPVFEALDVAIGELAAGTDGNLISYSSAGTATAVATGTVGQVLTSVGADEGIPVFETLSVTVAELANGTDGELFTWSTTGTATTVAVGTAGHVLTSVGAGEKPVFEELDVTVAELAAGTDGQIVTWSSAGTATTVGPGTSGQVLTSAGAGEKPSFTTLAGGGPSLGSDSIIRTNKDDIGENITFVAGGLYENGMSVGPITINASYAVTVASGCRWVII